MNVNLSISDVSRIAGIPKDLLRMWERRYAYPKPERDGNGDRVYSQEQLDKLILIRQLIDQGKRPGKLMKMALPELNELLRDNPSELDLNQLIVMLKSGQASELRNALTQQLKTQGLRAFIHQVMVPANRRVGEAWRDGELEIHEEHLYTEMISTLIRQSLVESQIEHGIPRVMLTTLPGEQHGLGLLMVEALLRLGGAEVIPFGIEMPFRDIIEAAETHQVDIIGLSFSAYFKLDDALVMLSGLRQMVDPAIHIWVGGNAFLSDTILPEGITLLQDLYEVERNLARWQGGSQ
ncbi:MAG: MerR family transcriptional regulator [Candidatus Thiodiazotropha sp.]